MISQDSLDRTEEQERAYQNGLAEGWQYSEDGLQRWRKRTNGSIECESVPQGVSMTRQEFKDDCDVNVILSRFMKTGQMPNWSSKSGVYGDFGDMPSYVDCMDVVVAADRAFMALPAQVRLKFNNSPQALMDYLGDPKNDDEAVSLGLKVARQPKVDPNQSVVDAVKGVQEAVAKSASRAPKKTAP